MPQVKGRRRLIGRIIVAVGLGFFGWYCLAVMRHFHQERMASMLVPNTELRAPNDRFFSVLSNRMQTTSGAPGGSDSRSKNTGLDNESSRSQERSGFIGQTALPRDEQVVKEMNEGVRLLNEGNAEQSLAHFLKVLELDAKSEDAHFNLGIAYARLGQADKAIAHYQAALEIMPEYAEVHNNLGNLLSNLRQFDQALQHLEKAVKIMPDYASGHNNLGTTLAKMGRFEAALVHFEKAIQLMPDYMESHFNLANTYSQLSRWDKAVTEYQEVLRLQPDFEPARRGLVRAQQHGGQTSP